MAKRVIDPAGPESVMLVLLIVTMAARALLELHRGGALVFTPYTGTVNIGDPAKYESKWCGNAGDGAGRRPRSATIVITRSDGGRIGT